MELQLDSLALLAPVLVDPTETQEWRDAGWSLKLPLIDLGRPGQTLTPVDGGKIEASYGPPQADMEANPYGPSRLPKSLYLANLLLENKVPVDHTHTFRHGESRWSESDMDHHKKNPWNGKTIKSINYPNSSYFSEKCEIFVDEIF